MRVSQQALGLITKAQVFDSSFNCIVGLAYPSMAAKFQQNPYEGDDDDDEDGRPVMNNGHVPFFDSVMSQGLLKHNIFTFYMGPDDRKHHGHGASSQLTFGWIDPTKYVGDINWHQVRLPVFWALKLDKVTISVPN